MHSRVIRALSFIPLSSFLSSFSFFFFLLLFYLYLCAFYLLFLNITNIVADIYNVFLFSRTWVSRVYMLHIISARRRPCNPYLREYDISTLYNSMSETREAASPPTALPLTSIFFSLYIIAWIKVREKEIEKERQVRDRKRFKLLSPAVRLTERTFNERERGREKERHFAFPCVRAWTCASLIILRYTAKCVTTRSWLSRTIVVKKKRILTFP